MVLGLIAVAVAGSLLSTDRALAALGAWGGLLVAVGVFGARTGSFGAGREVEIAATLLASFGAAVVAGAVFEMMRRRARPQGIGGVVALAAGFAAVGLLASTLLVIGPGRFGLPRDQMTGSFGFAMPSSGSPSRVLLFGESLPGTSRTIDGLSYRVFTPPYPATWDGYLNEPRIGDEALHNLLEELIDGRVRRAGAALADFGIGWVAFNENNALLQVFEAQLDMIPLTSLSSPWVLLNEVPAAPAVAIDGTRWVADGTGYRRPAGAETASEVVVASNGDFRWGPGVWEQDEWRNRVQGSLAEVSFTPYGPRRLMALGAGLWLVALSTVAALGRWRWRS